MTEAGALELAQLLRAAAGQLADAGVPAPRVDAELLAAHVLGTGRGELQAAALRGARLEPEQAGRLAELLRRRAAREPLQHLVGSAPFRGRELAVGPGVFVPRPETEVVAGLAIDAAREAALSAGAPLVVDLCTGSGAIALAVATELPQARVVAVELDPPAHAWAQRNLAGSGVDLRLGDVTGADRGLLADLAGIVDVVVANPPYIPPDAEPAEPEVRDHDPALALYGGGDDGLAVPRAVVATAAGLLRPGGVLVMEHAEVQAAAARGLTAAPLWVQVVTVRDLTGRDRAVRAVRTAVPPTTTARR